MYYEYVKYVLNSLLNENLISEDKIIPMDSIVENVSDYALRPSITYGNNTDWSNVRRTEEWILNLQFFVEHSNNLDVRKLCENIRNHIITNCSSIKILNTIYSVNNISLSSAYNTDFKSLSVVITVESKQSY